MLQPLRVWSTVLLGVAIGQAGFGAGLGASLIARPKSETLETIHQVNAWVVIVLAAVCVAVAARYRQQGGPGWPLVFAACLVGGGLLQAALGQFRVVGAHLFVGVLLLCAVTTFCSYAWRHQGVHTASTASTQPG
ncbi:MAG: hypothetical protein ABJA74_01820 [Lapillicoccus sp.]